MGCGCASFGFHACTSVPITERKQLRLIPEAKLNPCPKEPVEKLIYLFLIFGEGCSPKRDPLLANE